MGIKSLSYQLAPSNLKNEVTLKAETEVQRPFTWFTNDTFKKSNYFPGNDTYLVPNDYLTGSFPAIVRTLQKTLNFTLSVFKRYLVVLSWSEFMQWTEKSFEGAFFNLVYLM